MLTDKILLAALGWEGVKSVECRQVKNFKVNEHISQQLMYSCSSKFSTYRVPRDRFGSVQMSFVFPGCRLCVMLGLV